jgi:membrane protease YdiL (CAAX protease family)
VDNEPTLIERWGRTRPDIIFMAPYLAYLGLMSVQMVVPPAYVSLALLLKGVGGLVVFGMFLKYYPPLGKPHVLIGVVAGVVCAAGWVAGQYLFNSIEVGDTHLGERLFLFPGRIMTDPPPPYEVYNLGAVSWYSEVVARLAVTTITVPIVEELFWRGFLLRALIDWDRFERVPLGTFTWFSFLGTSLISTVQHPDNWAVSILCWMAFNGLMYWTRSITCLMITHGVTNLVLYSYVLIAGDWQFWYQPSAEDLKGVAMAVGG